MNAWVLILTLFGHDFQIDGPFTLEDCQAALHEGVSKVELEPGLVIPTANLPTSLRCHLDGVYL